jgi:hypothetical protein
VPRRSRHRRYGTARSSPRRLAAAAASGSREAVLKVGRAKLAAETTAEVAAMTYVARVTGIALSVAGLLGYGLAVCVRQCHSRPVLCCQQFLTHGAPLTGRNSPWNAHRAPPRLELFSRRRSGQALMDTRGTIVSRRSREVPDGGRRYWEPWPKVGVRPENMGGLPGCSPAHGPARLRLGAGTHPV